MLAWGRRLACRERVQGQEKGRVVIEVRQSDVRTNAANRLTIACLMLWMLGTAISLAIARWDLAQVQDATPKMMAYWNAHVFAFSPLSGASFAFLVLVLTRWWKGGTTLPSEAGHWYLTIQGSSLVIGWAAEVIRLTLAPDFGPPLPRWYNSFWRTAIFGFPVLLSLIACVKVRGNLVWRIMLVMLSGSEIASIVHTWKLTLFRVGSWFGSEFADGTFARALWSLPAAVAIIAAIYDWKLGRRHDVFHWIGIACLWLSTALEWPFWLWWWQVFR